MDSLDQFRADTQEWLQCNCPEEMRSPANREEQVWAGRDKIFPNESARLWFERMVAKGWTCPQWPIEYGGAGLTPQQAQILKEETKRIKARAPLIDLGIWMLGPALLEYGSEQQKREHLPAIAKGEIRWAQGYSEPEVGSDLASLKTVALDKSDHFLVNGTKLWTTHADKCDWIFCLARTDQKAPKQKGISFLLIDMQSTGVTVSPYKLINGASDFCTTSFSNVKVPKKNLVGKLNSGWQVAKALLKHERKLMSELSAHTSSLAISPIEIAQEYIGLNSQGKLANETLRQKLVTHEMNFRAIGLTHFRNYELQLSNHTNNQLPLIMKYIGTEEQKNRHELLISLMGNRGLGWKDSSFNNSELLATEEWLFSKALSIAGGTSEIQLNIIAKHILNLPE